MLPVITIIVPFGPHKHVVARAAECTASPRSYGLMITDIQFTHALFTGVPPHLIPPPEDLGIVGCACIVRATSHAVLSTMYAAASLIISVVLCDDLHTSTSPYFGSKYSHYTLGYLQSLFR
jgi:hypothetical protein